MSEEGNNNNGNDTGDANGNDGPDPVPYARFKEINDAKKAQDAQIATLTGEIDKLKNQLAAKEDEGKTELEKLQGDFDKMKGDLEAERQSRLRLEVATAKGVPANMADRLRGVTQEELESDADSIIEFLKPETPGVPPPPKGGKVPKFDLAGKSPEEIRQAHKDGKISYTE